MDSARSDLRAPARGLPRVDCAVLVVTYNSADDITGMLSSLPAAAGSLTFRVVAVDNGSIDGTLELLRGRPDVICVEAPTNLGYAGGINLARRYAGPCDTVLAINPDLSLDAGAIASLADAVADPGVGAAVPRILGADGALELSQRREPTISRSLGEALLGDRWKRRPSFLSEMVREREAYETRHPVEWATGAVVLVSAACERAVGPWDARFFLYSEEVDYAARVRAAGFRIDYVPASRARHRGGGSGSSAELVALMAVNRVRYAAKRGRQASAFRAVGVLHALLRIGDRGQRRALRVLLHRPSWAKLPAGAPSQAPRASAAELRRPTAVLGSADRSVA